MIKSEDVFSLRSSTVHGALCGLLPRTQVSECHVSGSSLKITAKRKRGKKCTLKASTWEKITSTHILLTSLVQPCGDAKVRKSVRYSCLVCSAEPELFDGEDSTIIVTFEMNR